MYLSNKGTVKPLDTPVTFNVKPLYKNTLEGASPEVSSAFWRSYESASRKASKMDKSIQKAEKKTKAYYRALMNSTANTTTGLQQLNTINNQINALKTAYYGNQAKLEIGEKNPPSVSDKLFTIYLSLERSTYGPTATNTTQMELINRMLNSAENDLNIINSSMEQFETLLSASGAPYIDD